MAQKKEVNWFAWTLYYVGRAFQLFGMVLVTSAFLYFGSNEMRRMLAITGVGAAFFVVGWLFSKDDPEGKKK